MAKPRRELSDDREVEDVEQEAVMDAYEFGSALSDRIKRWRRLSEKSISPLSLTVGEFRVLRVLSESGPNPMVELAREQTITQAAVTGIVDRLEKLKLIERVNDEADRRVVMVEITTKGREEVKKGMRLYRKFVEKATHALSVGEKLRLLATFDQMLEAAEGP